MTSKLIVYKITLIACMIITCHQSKCSHLSFDKKPMVSYQVAYGFEPQFTNNSKKIYSDRSCSECTEPILRGRTQLHCVQSIEEAAQALKYGADINAKDNNGCTPLGYMLMRKQHAITEYLTQNGACLSSDDEKHLFRMYALSDEQYFDQLCRLEAIRTKNTLLYIQSIQEAKKALEYGADIHAKNDYGATPIACAITQKNITVACYLKYCGGVLSPDHEKYLLHAYAIEDPVYLSKLYQSGLMSPQNGLLYATCIEEILYALEHNADINAIDSNGKTVIQRMIHDKKLAAILYLWQKKAYITDEDKKLIYQQYAKLSSQQKHSLSGKI